MSITMPSSEVIIHLPSQVYEDLLELQTATLPTPVDIIIALVKEARQHRAWQRDLAELQVQVRRDGGFPADETDDELVERLRQTRQEIFEAEYAHLYR